MAKWRPKASYLGFPFRNFGKILLNLRQLVPDQLQRVIADGSLLFGGLGRASHLFLQHVQFSRVSCPQHLALHQSFLKLVDLSTPLQSGYLSFFFFFTQIKRQTKRRKKKRLSQSRNLSPCNQRPRSIARLTPDSSISPPKFAPATDPFASTIFSPWKRTDYRRSVYIYVYIYINRKALKTRK